MQNTIKAVKIGRNQKVTEQHAYHTVTFKQYIILVLSSHGLTFAKSYAFIHSSVCTKISKADKATTFSL